VYNVYVDGDTKYGSSSGLPRRPVACGAWYNGSNCGSRCTTCDFFSAYSGGDFCARGCSQKKNK